MKEPFGIWFIALLLLLPIFASGCGCGGEAPADLVAIEVTPANPSIALGTHQQFTAIGIFSNNNDKRDITKTVIWNSADASVAEIGNETGTKGLAISKTIGSTQITATSGRISGSTTLTVTAAALVSISVSPENPSIAQGFHQQFKATGTFTDSTTQDITTSVDWSSSITSIAVISNADGSKGLATATGAGSTIITATSGNISGSTSLTVTPAVLVSITVTPSNSSVGYHSTVQYTAMGTFSDNTTQDITTSVIWSSSDSSVATISNEPGSKGLATTGGVPGRTVITATLGSISGSALLIDP